MILMSPGSPTMKRRMHYEKDFRRIGPIPRFVEQVIAWVSAYRWRRKGL